MKIQHGMQPQKAYRPLERNLISTSELGKEFSDLLSSAGKELTKEKMQQLLNQIDEQGKRLGAKKNLQELKKYKELIKKFMDEAVQTGLEFNEQQSFDRYGRTKKYKIIRQIDEKLMDLTNRIVDKEQKQIDILDKIGEIKGLLINLYL